ncbi:hypothetical protein N0V88_000222 [Collariella sp. IMI 366227]|nr:hypothetical protein N0V88_000222 [Collariella sp. IMI 366227]
MFKVSHRSSFEANSPSGDESDDNISLTSTASGHDSDEEFEVENILAEQLSNGVMWYLVEWTGFPLHQSTWEPEINLGDDLKAIWEENKAKNASGELELFDIQKFYDACDKADNEKAERHHRRNAKRAKLGLLAEVYSQRKEDIAPDASRISLTALRTGLSTSRRSSAASILSPSPIPLTPQHENHNHMERGMSPVSATAGLDGAPPKKKRKSVRFFVEDDDDFRVMVQEPEPMDLDSLVQQSPQAIAAPRRPSLETSRINTTPQATQNSDKQLLLGGSSVKVTFNGLPRESPGQGSWQWLADFMGKETLEFRHTCFAQTASYKLLSLVQPALAGGTITSKKDDSAVEHVAEYLTGGLLALYYGQAGLNVLVYPRKCDEWRRFILGPEPVSPSESALGYYIFASPQDPTLFLPPPEPLSESALRIGDPTTKVKSEQEVAARDLIMKRLFHFDYDKLLPGVSGPLPADNFFLAVPKTRGSTGQALYHWLRSCNPQCQIFTSQHAGGWDAFRARVEAIPGVVIIHETLMWTLRRFPGLSKDLITRNDEYWCISEPVHGLPLYPSMSIAEYPVPPGNMQLTRLFPYRTAILLTPSFLVSEPRRALEFFKWFSKWVGNYHYRLVTAHNIHEYLLELAEERDQAGKDLRNYPGDIEPELDAERNGLTEEDRKCRYIVASMAADMHLSRELTAGAFAHEEDNSSLVYADPFIDPNDEQSLVNWFGWWTTLRADQFRKFHVIGSSQSIKFPGSRRGERRVRIPKYTDVTLNNPDAVLEVLQERNDQADATEIKETGKDLAQEPIQEERVSLSDGPWAFRSDLIRTEDRNLFAQYLHSINPPEGKSLYKLYMFPVSWKDLDMAEHFDDFQAKFHRIQDWFKFALPFGSLNTYAGFFYTITEEYDSDSPPPKKPLQRHPWFVIYRPVNPHRRPFGRCEVIIWDPAAKMRYANKKAIAEKDLTFMQRQVIQHIREHGEEKNHGTWLDQAWIAGWDWPADCDSPNPIDVTLLFLRKVLKNLRDYLPAPEAIMQSKGYRRIALDNSGDAQYANKVTESPTTMSGKFDSPLFVSQENNTPMDLDSLPKPPKTTTTTTIITTSPALTTASLSTDNHDLSSPPPQTPASSSTRPGATPIFTDVLNWGLPFRSECVNHLHEEARLAKARADPARGEPKDMVYRYMPTLEWYREQKAEGNPSISPKVHYHILLPRTFSSLDVFGPLKILQALSRQTHLTLSLLSRTLVPVSTAPISAAINLYNLPFFSVVVSTHTYADNPPLDVLIVPRSLASRSPDLGPETEYMRRVFSGLRYLVTICTDAGIAAQAGVLDGRMVTTN